MENNHVDNNNLPEKLIKNIDYSFIRENQYEIYKVIIGTVEKSLIEKVLETTYGNQLKAAKLLGINRNTLRTKIKKLGINPDNWKI